MLCVTLTLHLRFLSLNALHCQDQSNGHVNKKKAISLRCPLLLKCGVPEKTKEGCVGSTFFFSQSTMQLRHHRGGKERFLFFSFYLHPLVGTALLVWENMGLHVESLNSNSILEIIQGSYDCFEFVSLVVRRHRRFRCLYAWIPSVNIHSTVNMQHICSLKVSTLHFASKCPCRQPLRVLALLTRPLGSIRDGSINPESGNDECRQDNDAE